MFWQTNKHSMEWRKQTQPDWEGQATKTQFNNSAVDGVVGALVEPYQLNSTDTLGLNELLQLQLGVILLREKLNRASSAFCARTSVQESVGLSVCQCSAVNLPLPRMWSPCRVALHYFVWQWLPVNKANGNADIATVLCTLQYTEHMENIFGAMIVPILQLACCEKLGHVWCWFFVFNGQLKHLSAH